MRFRFGLGVLSALCVMTAAAIGSEPVRVVAVDGPDRDAKQPQVAVDSGGRIYVVFGRGNTVRLAVSSDGGRSYGVNTVGSVDSLALGMRRGPRVAATSEAVVVTAIGGREGKGRDGDVLAWRSPDGGKTWTGPSRVNTVEGSAREGLHGMAAGPDGRVFCTWLDLRNKRTEIYGSLSKDGGATWGPDALVYRSPEKSVCECCHPSAAFSPDGTLHVMWRNQLKGARDLYLCRSSDGGKTFGPAEKLGRGTWPLKACPMDGGAIAAGADGRVQTVWMRAGTMFVARPGEVERELGRGVQGWTAVGPDGPYDLWLEKRPGKLLALTPDRETPITLSEGAADPVVAAAPGGRGPVVAAWEAKETGGIVAHVFAPRAVGFKVEGLPEPAETTTNVTVPFAVAPSGELGVTRATKADEKAIAALRTCPVSKEDLGSMGGPLKVTRGDKSTFICCKGCLKDLQANPDKFFGAQASAAKGEHDAHDHKH